MSLPGLSDAATSSDARATDGGAMPNLTPVIQNTQIQERTFGASACEVMEGCTVVGSRRLLACDLLTPNIGEADLYLGAPTTAGRPSSMFEFGTCHNHWHLRGYADYRLFDMAGAEVGRGHKQSFCLLDSARYMGMSTDIPAESRYNCGNQGIHAGWYDAYGRSLDCQYVDITDVPAGTYRLRAQVNVERVLAESRYDDNEVFMTVVIPPRPLGPDGGLPGDPTLACGGADEGLNRDCGWTTEGAPRTCTPGARVQIGCNAGCSPPSASARATRCSASAPRATARACATRRSPPTTTRAPAATAARTRTSAPTSRSPAPRRVATRSCRARFERAAPTSATSTSAENTSPWRRSRRRCGPG